MNLRPLRPERSALPNCAIPRNIDTLIFYHILLPMSIKIFDKFQNSKEGTDIFTKIADKIADILAVKQTDNQFVYVIKNLINRFDTHNVAQTAGQFAFFTMLSIFPFIIS